MTPQDDIETALMVLPDGTQLAEETSNYLCFVASTGITLDHMQTLRDYAIPVVLINGARIVLERSA
jgi:hypothetical protein